MQPANEGKTSGLDESPMPTEKIPSGMKKWRKKIKIFFLEIKKSFLPLQSQTKGSYFERMFIRSETKKKIEILRLAPGVNGIFKRPLTSGNSSKQHTR
ncbi:MAG: hypothetical protein EOO99_12210 [Pedobacter sp.]|nr:MAG: hypothetical protein EOO99_12210 [Pedobacter sp.]